MRAMLAVVSSIALAVLSWGSYIPVLHKGQEAMNGRLRPFICVGLAYIAVAVIVPLALLIVRGEKGRWTPKGLIFSLAGGTFGALGALGVILAQNANGAPLLVIPLIFGCAPVVNTFVTMYLNKNYKEVGPWFLAGLILVITGAVTVLVFKPSDGAGGAGFMDMIRSSLKALVWVAFTAVCWGIYGPILHKGQAAMSGSRLRPFLCVGVAYIVIAVVIPFALLGAGSESSGDWTARGVTYSLAGGAAGALGALGIILAFNFGGKPVYVMPLVFGGAPVVGTIISLVLAGGVTPSPYFFAGLIAVAVGAVTVLVFAPKPHAHPVPAAR
jgi:drug/metabolite transporter (DMT)-like permease